MDNSIKRSEALDVIDTLILKMRQHLSILQDRQISLTEGMQSAMIAELAHSASKIKEVANFIIITNDIILAKFFIELRDILRELIAVKNDRFSITEIERDSFNQIFREPTNLLLNEIIKDFINPDMAPSIKINLALIYKRILFPIDANIRMVIKYMDISNNTSNNINKTDYSPELLKLFRGHTELIDHLICKSDDDIATHIKKWATEKDKFGKPLIENPDNLLKSEFAKALKEAGIIKQSERSFRYKL